MIRATATLSLSLSLARSLILCVFFSRLTQPSLAWSGGEWKIGLLEKECTCKSDCNLVVRMEKIITPQSAVYRPQAAAGRWGWERVVVVVEVLCR